MFDSASKGDASPRLKLGQNTARQNALKLFWLSLGVCALCHDPEKLGSAARVLFPT